MRMPKSASRCNGAGDERIVVLVAPISGMAMRPMVRAQAMLDELTAAKTAQAKIVAIR